MTKRKMITKKIARFVPFLKGLSLVKIFCFVLMHCLFYSVHAHMSDPAKWTVYTYTSV
jgi:hypothetical protein